MSNNDEQMLDFDGNLITQTELAWLFWVGDAEEGL